MARAGNDYMQRESRDGQLTTGLYQVLLPDGRYQVSFPFSYFEMVGSSFKVNKVPAGRPTRLPPEAPSSHAIAALLIVCLTL